MIRALLHRLRLRRASRILARGKAVARDQQRAEIMANVRVMRVHLRLGDGRRAR